MVNLVREAQESKKKIILSAMVATLTIVAAFPLFLLSGILEMENWLRVLLIAIGLVVVCGGIVIACILDREAVFVEKKSKERIIGTGLFHRR